MSKDQQLLLILVVTAAGYLLVPETSALGVGLNDVLDIIKLGKDVVVTIAKAWNIVDQHVDFSEIPIPILDKTESKLFGKIGIISAKLERVAGQIDAVDNFVTNVTTLFQKNDTLTAKRKIGDTFSEVRKIVHDLVNRIYDLTNKANFYMLGTTTISLVLQNLPDRVRLELRLNDLLDYMTRMDVNYRHFQNYVKDQKGIERLTLEDFAKNVVSHDSSSIRSLIERIHAFIVPNGQGIANTGLLKLLRKSLETMITLNTLIWFCGLASITLAEGRDPTKLVTVDKLRWDFLGLEETLWDYVLDYLDNNIKQEEVLEVNLIRKFEEFGDKINEALPHDLSYGLDQLNSVWSLQLAYADLRGIYALYETFRRFQKQQTAPGRIPSPKQAWTDLAETVLHDSKNNVEVSMSRIHDIVMNNMFQNAKKEVEGDMLCNSQQSPQQVLLNLYNAIALTELKGYTMIQFSYMLLRLYDQGNFTKEAQLMRDRYQERTDSAVETVRNVMKNASRGLWNCDPKKHIKGETYEEITQLLQGYIQNEVDLNPDGTCRENCAEYTYTKSHGCFKNLYCRQQKRCNGKIINCKFFDSDMWICPASPLSGRRYEYVEYENGLVLGRKQGCSRGTTKVDSWWRWLFWHCSYCFCLCDEQGSNSDRYFNMRPAIANIANNRVVTGLRFIKKNRIIHLQIQEGELLPRGKINIDTVHWVPVEEYKITDRKIFNGQDYHTLTWEKRAIDLDDLEAPEGHLVTGVRFKEIGSHLNFEIFVTKFDFDTGKLVNPTSTSTWKDNPNTDASIENARTKVKLTHPDIPTRSPSPSVPTSQSDQYIEFTHTDINRDAAQTTVPFLDAQKLESLQAVPLSGAGIFHKGRNNFGGFITPKIITYDFSRHLKAAFPGEEVN